VTDAIDFSVPPSLLAALRTPWREAMEKREAQARRDAALICRIERAYCRSHGIDGWERNGRARIARRRYLAGLGYSV
jgi:hypothetical protein